MRILIALLALLMTFSCGRIDRQYEKVISENETITVEVFCLTLLGIPVFCLKDTERTIEVKTVVEIAIAEIVKPDKQNEVPITEIVEEVKEEFDEKPATIEEVTDIVISIVKDSTPTENQIDTPPKQIADNIAEQVIEEIETPVEDPPVVETPPPKSNNSGIHSITVHDQQYISVSNSYPYQAPGQAWEMKNKEGTLYLIVGSSATYTKSLVHEHNDGDIGPHHHHDDNINHGGNHEIHNHGNNYDSYHVDQYTHKHTYEVPQIDEKISFPNADYLFVENHQIPPEAGNPWSFTFLPSEPGQAIGIARPVDTDYITVSGGGKTVKIIAP